MRPTPRRRSLSQAAVSPPPRRASVRSLASVMRAPAFCLAAHHPRLLAAYYRSKGGQAGGGPKVPQKTTPVRASLPPPDRQVLTYLGRSVTQRYVKMNGLTAWHGRCWFTSIASNSTVTCTRTVGLVTGQRLARGAWMARRLSGCLTARRCRRCAARWWPNGGEGSEPC